MEARVAELSTNKIEGNAWDKLTRTTGADFYQAWLSLQCELITGIRGAILVVRKEGGKGALDSFEPVAVWPESKQEGLESVAELVDQVIEQESGLITVLKPALENHFSTYGVAYPIKQEKQLVAVIAATVAVDDKKALQQVMKQLQWGAAWVELSFTCRRHGIQQALYSRLAGGVDLLAKILPEQAFDAAAMRLVSEMAVAQQCELVSLGLVKRGGVEVSHLSNSAQFGKKMNFLRYLEAAMNEAVDQRKLVVVPEPAGLEQGVISLAHTGLSEQQQRKSLLTLPLFVNEQCIGAMTLQRDIDFPFTLDEIQYCESIVALVSVSLEEKRLNSRPLYTKVYESGKEQATRLLGPGYLGRKLVCGLLALMVMFFSTADSLYRLSASASLEPVMQRIVVAPYDGFIQQAPVRAGDIVSKGDLLFSLDDGDLQLEKLNWLSQQTKLTRQYQEETASHNRANVNVIQAQLAQVRAELQLVESQLARSRQAAPFDGLVVSGDLSQQLGGAVNQGDKLFEISPVNAYRVYLKVEESRIADVKLGQTGSLFLSALPEKSFPFEINKLTPLTVSESGTTFFTVEARLLEHSGQFQPGMEGIGKIDIGERKLWSIWTRDLVERLRLLFWSWWA